MVKNKNNKDISGNKINDCFNNSKLFILNNNIDKSNKLFYLEDSKEKINIFSKKLYVSPKQNIYNKSLNDNDKHINITIKRMVDTIEKKRKENIIKNRLSTIIEKIDKNNNDISNNSIICINDKENLNKTLTKINYKYDHLFSDNTNKFLCSRNRTYSIYDRNNEFSKYLKYKYAPPNPVIEVKKKKINISAEINNIKDIIELIEKYPLKDDVEYNINMKAIHNIKEPIIELNDMIGMHLLKKSITDQILFFIQDLHINNKNKEDNDFMHTCIYGPPGTGKTEIAKIIGKIYSKMGILKKGTFKKATRADFIAGYLGQTALKTKTLIQECIGGVLFIDEAYALGNPEKRDSFAKECIDTLCESLSDNKSDLMVIIAGYKEELKNCFFNYNKGLDSRFTWRFKTDDYNAEELKLIFFKKIKDIDWKIKKNIKTSWFEKNKSYFKFYGRDMETLLAKVKIAHGRRVFCLDEKEKKIISLKDMNKGFELFLENDEVKSRNEHSTIKHMYV